MEAHRPWKGENGMERWRRERRNCAPFKESIHGGTGHRTALGDVCRSPRVSRVWYCDRSRSQRSRSKRKSWLPSGLPKPAHQGQSRRQDENVGWIRKPDSLKLASLVLNLTAKAPTPSNLLYSLPVRQLPLSIYTSEKTEAQGHLVISLRAPVFSIVKFERWFSWVMCGSCKFFMHSFTWSFRAYYIPSTVIDRQDPCTPMDSRETKNEGELDKVVSGSDKL